jgi:putative ubiquitin-RnfH superfamily antitoxin RatB of RatAB toxin-antitoxin module
VAESVQATSQTAAEATCAGVFEAVVGTLIDLPNPVASVQMMLAYSTAVSKAMERATWLALEPVIDLSDCDSPVYGDEHDKEVGLPQ